LDDIARLKVNPANDAFGAKLIQSGVSAKQIEDWSVDPQVKGIDKLFELLW
jgi:hypothetical protein